MKINLLFAAFLVLGARQLSAQDLHIYCDAFTDSVYYLRNGRPVEDALVRKGEQIVLHVTNYNSYLYDIRLESENQSVAMSQGQFGNGFAAGLSGGANPFGLLLKSIGGGFPTLPMLTGGKMDNDKMGWAEDSKEEEEVKQLKKIEIEFNRTLENMRQTEGELSDLEGKIQQALMAQKLQSFAIDEIDRLRYDPNLEPAQIKQRTREYAQQLFDESDPEKLTLTYVLQKTEAKQTMGDLISQYRTRVLRYERFQKKTTELSLALENIKLTDTNLDEFREVAAQANQTGAEKSAAFSSNLENLVASQQNNDNFDPVKMAALRSSYLSLMSKDFNKVYRQVAEGDNLNLRVKLEPVDSARYLGARSKQLPPIPVKVYGGLRVNTGVGVGFAQFFTQPKDYFVRDSVVASADKDDFMPVLSTFVHFYSPRPGNLSWGGSFGVGLPLGSEDAIQSISFFLGPSLIIGQGQNIVISGGLMGGKVKSPAQGYQVGDRFESDAAFFTTDSHYALGYFLGVSFNIIGQ